MQGRGKLESNIFFVGNKDIDLEVLQLFNSHLVKLDEIKEMDIPKFNFNSISLRMVKKFYITSELSPGSKVLPADLLEVVDYDPVRDSALAVGSKNKPGDLPIHWFIYRAFMNVNGIANLNIELDEKAKGSLGIRSISKDLKVIRSETVLELLPQFKDNNRLSLLDRGIIFNNINFEAVVDDVIKFAKELEKLNVQTETDKKEDSK